jgi:two-component system, OmpR family, sensor kinase
LKRFFSKKISLPPESATNDLEQSVKKEMLDLFIHDLRVPLSVVCTSVEKLIQKRDVCGSLTDTQQRLLERILRNSRKAQRLIQDMIEVFRSQAGIFHPRAFAPGAVLREALVDVLEVSAVDALDKMDAAESMDAFGKQMAGMGIFVEITGKYAEKPFEHDPGKIRQIWRNLISNGMKFHRRRLTITISGDHDLLFSVEDDGPGIPLEKQTQIFERFTRFDIQESEVMPGLGLGLSGVKALVKAMGGEIALFSREGAGCRFEVRIPPLTGQKREQK